MKRRYKTTPYYDNNRKLSIYQGMVFLVVGFVIWIAMVKFGHNLAVNGEILFEESPQEDYIGTNQYDRPKTTTPTKSTDITKSDLGEVQKVTLPKQETYVEPAICLDIQRAHLLVDRIEDAKKLYYTYADLDTRIQRINLWIDLHNDLINSVNYLYYDVELRPGLLTETCDGQTVERELALLINILEKDGSEIERQDYSLRKALPDDYTLDWA